MSDGADQPQEQTTPAGQPSHEAGKALVLTGPFFQRTDWLSFGVTAVVVLAVYFRTLAPEVTLEYSGILSTSAKYAGVAHPPGYPVWTLYSWLFVTLLPFVQLLEIVGEAASRVSVLEKIMLHCCGGVRELLPGLIDAGLDAINPVQITCRSMEPAGGGKPWPTGLPASAAAHLEIM